MKKTLIATTAIALTLGFGGIANAGKDETGNPGKGNQGCAVNVADEGDPDEIVIFKNPGKALQWARANGINPPAGAKEDGTTLGALIDEACGDPS